MRKTPPLAPPFATFSASFFAFPFASLFATFFVFFFALDSFPARAQDLPDAAAVYGVNGHPQGRSLSCESRSAADWAAFWGVSISEETFLGELPRSDDPNLGFVGNPDDAWGAVPPWSYGVHAGPVADLLVAYGLPADARRDLAWEDLQAEIAANRPVIVWIIGQMWVGNPRQYTTSQGEDVTVAPFEHTMILVGYDEASIQAVDAYSGATLTFSLRSFLLSWSALGNMAIVAEGDPAPPETPPARREAGESYTVQPGDYLTALAHRFDVSWQDLAALNGIPYPYVIYPGQELKLPGALLPEDAQAFVSRQYLPLLLYRGVPVPPPPPPPAPTSTPAPPETYIVQRGDSLTSIGERFGLTWFDLAVLNGMSFPYILYPGQELKIR